MELRNMRQLLAIHATGSVAKAAASLGMSQPSLSQAILRLEDELKVKLVHRTPSGSHLTPIGELIIERAAKVVAEAEQLVREAELIAGGEFGLVRIGVGSALKHSFLPRFVRQIAERHPGLRLSFLILDRDRLIPMVAQRELDMVICALGDEVAAGPLIATPICATRAAAATSPNHPLAGLKAIPLDRLAEFPLAGANSVEFSNARLMGLGPDHQDRYMANDYDALLPLAADGQAVLIAPEFVVRPHVEAGVLVELDLAWRCDVTYAAIASQASLYSPVIAKLIVEATELGTALDCC